MGNRVKQTVGANVTQYLLDLQPGLSVVLAATEGMDTICYVHGPMGIHAHKDAAGNWEWMLQDGLGTVRGVVDNDVSVLESRLYDPIGVLLGASGTNQTMYDFTGEPMDNNGLLYLRARYYAPSLGVFTALDPFETANRYSYVSGDPINRTDPAGLFDWCTGQIQQGDTLWEIARQGTHPGGSPREILATMNRIMQANPIITNPNRIGFTWPPLNIPADIKAFGQTNNGISCTQPTTTTGASASSCDCETGYIWRPDWRMCVPIIPTPPPPLPYEENTGELPEWYIEFRSTNPCFRYQQLARELGVYWQVDAVFLTGRFPRNLNLSFDDEMALYAEYNSCMVHVFEATDFANCGSGAISSIALDLLSFIPGVGTIATATSIAVSLVQVLADPNDLETRQGLNRSLGGALNTDAAGQVIEQLGSVDI